ncbi:Hypothetical protein SRAE_X000051200 [Strongyloides ratti]|uniref:Uncharacterized protein n=1 Tax=Strongyloides ratti TaxID=34506 RepID=A0A090LMZ0_STRRB|nr:Hypothetical protein SRAE_X000051200 [Strongyloides ratti]CEF71185.1 Hypothetical protein SRAE_X000051200 [Strongyloides ratti]
MDVKLSVIESLEEIQLCTQCGARCGMQTQIKIIGSIVQGRGSIRRGSFFTVSQRQRNVHANAIHEDANDPIYATVQRRSQRNRLQGGGFHHGGGSFRGHGGFNRPGSMHHSPSVIRRRNAALANARRDSDEY